MKLKNKFRLSACFANCHFLSCLWSSVNLWVCCEKALLGNVHRKGHSSICCRDAVHDGGQGTHVPLLWRVSSTQEICKETQSHVQDLHEGALRACLRSLCVKCTHPRCCSSVCTVRECCSTRGYCSRCCLNWAHLTMTPVTAEIHRSRCHSLCVMTWHVSQHKEAQRTLMVQCNATHAVSHQP